MIRLFNSSTKVSVPYKTFEEVCDHFRRVEHLKPIQQETQYDVGLWDFIYWPHKRLSVLHEHFKGNPFNQIERQAYEGEFDLIEIFDGRPQCADQYVVTPELDIERLMREWCFGYAFAHGYTILQTFSCEFYETFSFGAPYSLQAPRFEGSRSNILEGA